MPLPVAHRMDPVGQSETFYQGPAAQYPILCGNAVIFFGEPTAGDRSDGVAKWITSVPVDIGAETLGPVSAVPWITQLYGAEFEAVHVFTDANAFVLTAVQDNASIGPYKLYMQRFTYDADGNVSEGGPLYVQLSEPSGDFPHDPIWPHIVVSDTEALVWRHMIFRDEFDEYVEDRLYGSTSVSLSSGSTSSPSSAYITPADYGFHPFKRFSSRAVRTGGSGAVLVVNFNGATGPHLGPSPFSMVEYPDMVIGGADDFLIPGGIFLSQGVGDADVDGYNGEIRAATSSGMTVVDSFEVPPDMSPGGNRIVTGVVPLWTGTEVDMVFKRTSVFDPVYRAITSDGEGWEGDFISRATEAATHFLTLDDSFDDGWFYRLWALEPSVEPPSTERAFTASWGLAVGFSVVEAV